MAKAGDHIKKAQATKPPWREVDRAKQLYAMLEPDLPAELRALHGSGRLVVGEIGDDLPNACARPLGGGEHAVELNSGLIEFIYGVTRTLVGSSTLISPDNTYVPALSHDDLVRRVADVAMAWKAGKYWSGEKFRHPDFPLSAESKRITHGLSVNAELFTLAHELGHVFIALRPPDPPMPRDLEEVTADQFAVVALLKAAPRLGWRLMFAGMMLQIRIFALLERLGWAFDRRYPTPAERMTMLKIGVRKQLSDEFSYAVVSTMAVAYDELMEGVENVILGEPVSTHPTVERLQARFITIAEEWSRGNLTLEEAGSDVASGLEAVPEAMLRTVAGRLYDWFFAPVGAGFHDPTGGNRAHIAAGLLALAFDLPEPAQTVFRESGVWPKFGSRPLGG